MGPILLPQSHSTEVSSRLNIQDEEPATSREVFGLLCSLCEGSSAGHKPTPGALGFAAFPYHKFSSPTWKTYNLIWSPEYQHLWCNLFSCPSFTSTYSQPSSQSTSPFSLYIPEAHSLKCKGCLNAYENLHGHALRASNLYVKTQLFTAKRQQQIKMSPHLPWADWGHQRQEELTGPWEWWPQSRSTCIVAPHLPYRGWPHSTQSSQIHNKTKSHLTLHHIIQYLLLSRKSPLCV